MIYHFRLTHSFIWLITGLIDYILFDLILVSSKLINLSDTPLLAFLLLPHLGLSHLTLYQFLL